MKRNANISFPKALGIFLVRCFLVPLTGGGAFLGAQELNLKFNHITTDDGLSQNTIHGIVKDKYGFMWFGTWEGLNRFDGYTFKNFRANENDSSSLSNNRVNNLYIDAGNDIWIATGDQAICKYNYETENFTRFTYAQIPSEVKNGLSKGDINGNRVVQTKSYRWEIESPHLIQTNLGNGQTTRYTKDPFDSRALNDINLTDLYMDNAGILWVGTETGGVNMADTRAKPFETYGHSPVSPNSLAENVVRAICEDRSGNIWVGTLNNGITVIDTKTNRFTHLRRNNDTDNGIISNNIRSLYADRAGYVWIGTKNGLTRFDPVTQKCTNYSSSESGSKKIPNNWVFYITEDHLNNLWIATFNGIARYNPKTESFVAYPPEGLLMSKNVRVILEDHLNNLWIATEGGGITLVKAEQTGDGQVKLAPVKHFTYSPTDKASLINNTILTLAEDENGIIWVGTNNGLCRINTANMLVERLDIPNFPDNLIMGIECDGKGHIWIGHKKGLTRLNTKELTIRNFTKSDGVQGNEFSQNAHFRSPKTGKIYFGGTNGLTAFHPNEIIDNPFIPTVAITSLWVNNQLATIASTAEQSILDSSVLVTDGIELQHTDKSVAIEFAALHYSNPLANQYKYKLEGYDHDWIATDAAHRVATYQDLSPGTYSFWVMAANSDGIWNPTATCLIIKMTPPWWQNGIAYTLYIMVMLLGGYAAIAHRRKKALAQAPAHKPAGDERHNNADHIDAPAQPLPVNHLSAEENGFNELMTKGGFNYVCDNVVDQTFIQQTIDTVKANISDTNFNTELLSHMLNMSQRQLYRRIKTLTNATVHDFITTIRLAVAAEMLLTGKHTIAEISYKVGFTEPSNFTRTFTKRFGESPSAYIRRAKPSK